MAFNCPGCGRENVDGARFCQSCGITITQPSSATVIQPPAPDPSTAPTTSLPTVTPNTAPAYTPPAPAYTPPAPAYTPPAPAYTPPAQTYVPPAQPYSQPIQPQPYAPAPPVYQQPAYQQPAYQQPAYSTAGAAGSQRSNAFYVGAVIVLLCGILILVSSFMAWYGVPGFSESGWELMKDMQDGGQNPFVNTADLGPEGSKLMFSGLCSVIVGGAIFIFGLLALLLKSKGLAGFLLCLSLAALVIAGINTFSFLTIEGFSLGAGMYLFLVGSLGGTVGSIVCMAG